MTGGRREQLSTPAPHLVARVAVVIPAYNSERFVATCLESVLAQTFDDLVAVVVDDGSTDQTLAIVKSYAAQSPRVGVVQQANAGPGSARNRGIEATESEFVALVDADDSWFPERLRRCIELFDEHPEAVLVTSNALIITEDGSVIGEMYAGGSSFPLPGDVLARMARDNVIFSSCVLRRSTLKAAGNFSEEAVLIGVEDYDLWLRVLLGGSGTAVCVPEPLARYTLRPDGMSLAHPERNERARLEVVRRHARALAERGAYCRPGDAVELLIQEWSGGRRRTAVMFASVARRALKIERRSFTRLVVGRLRRRRQAR